MRIGRADHVDAVVVDCHVKGEEEEEVVAVVEGGGGTKSNNVTSTTTTINVFRLHLDGGGNCGGGRSTSTVMLSELGASIQNWYVSEGGDDDGDYSYNSNAAHENDNHNGTVDIVAGYKDVKTCWRTKNPYYFGTICGRVCNRIQGGQFTLGRTDYQLPVMNDVPRNNTLHGGPLGFSHVVWTGKVVNDGTAVEFTLLSEDGDQGFPGRLEVKATYSLRDAPSSSSVVVYRTKDDGAAVHGVILQLHLEARLVLPDGADADADDDADAIHVQTPVNLTNHTYWNLDGQDSATTTATVNENKAETETKSGPGILDHLLQLECDEYTPVSPDTLISTRDVVSVRSTPGMDFRSPIPIRTSIQQLAKRAGAALGHDMTDDQVMQHLQHRHLACSHPYGLDDNFVVRRDQQQGVALPCVARLTSSGSGRHATTSSSAATSSQRRRRRLTVYSDAPGLQVYTANYLHPDATKDNCKTSYGPWSAICLETQHYPDSISVRSSSSSDFDKESSGGRNTTTTTTTKFWDGKCLILTKDKPMYEQTVEYNLEQFDVVVQDGDTLGGLPTIVVGSDTDGTQYTSVEEMWECQNLDRWYITASDWYEDNCPPSIDGVLGGIGHVSPVDLNGSRQFLQQLLVQTLNESTTATSVACEVGAGIGRVTKGLLLDFADRCDLVESSPRLLASAPDHLGPLSSRCRFFCSGLQDWTPPRCAAALDEDCGYIVLKENTCEDELFVVDVDDASLTRSVEYWQDLIFRAGLRVIQIQMQGDFPDEIYPVPMMALRPW